MATKKFKCKVCGYIHEGDAAPAKCPVCGAPASEFEEIVEAGAGDAGAKKGGLMMSHSRNSSSSSILRISGGSWKLVLEV